MRGHRDGKSYSFFSQLDALHFSTAAAAMTGADSLSRFIVTLRVANPVSAWLPASLSLVYPVPLPALVVSVGLSFLTSEEEEDLAGGAQFARRSPETRRSWRGRPEKEKKKRSEGGRKCSSTGGVLGERPGPGYERSSTQGARVPPHSKTT